MGTGHGRWFRGLGQWRATLLALAGLSSLVSPLAAAQPEAGQDAPSTFDAQDPAIEARALFEKGLVEAEQGKPAEALTLFRESLAITPRASTALNMAIVLVRMDRLREALIALDEHGRLAEL